VPSRIAICALAPTMLSRARPLVTRAASPRKYRVPIRAGCHDALPSWRLTGPSAWAS